MSVLQDRDLDSLLVGLHQTSDQQLAALMGDYETMKQEGGEPSQEQLKEFLRDKLIALDRDKAQFCYQICRAIAARRIVEVGTSFGISTVYLAAALRDNMRAGGAAGMVIGTEYEPAKIAAARDLYQRAGVSDLIDLREGDLRDTLRQIEGPIDFVLIDTWTEIARPALELIDPHLREGAVVLCDNTEEHRADYGAYFEFIRDPANRFRTMTLPFKGGLEMSVRC